MFRTLPDFLDDDDVALLRKVLKEQLAHLLDQLVGVSEHRCNSEVAFGEPLKG
ncbi:hypothetical protein [Glaciibacter sp. 2TAF33]|uniref:hypothetical protein n=1 Tax=Glaciibacter sp. 2TAF33 TaxID=3233015 RepID=UPI003F92334E